MINKHIQPIFILSLPRSGSTLMQRVLGGAPEISTVSEPWVLLPMFYALKKKGVYAEYGHDVLVGAVEDLCQSLPNNKRDYHEAVASFANDLYGKLATPEAQYFLDKTPRYHLIAEEIIQAFPNAKIIFLWRNPLSIVSSIINTWGKKGQWNLHASKIDLFTGIDNLTDAYIKNKDTVLSVNYERFLEETESEWARIFEYLEIPFKRSYIEQFSEVKLKGKLGDPTGVKDYQVLSTSTKEKWKKELSNPIRKFWCDRYLKFIGKERLLIMGYDFEELLKDLHEEKTTLKYIFSDCVGLLYGLIYSYLEPKFFLDKLKRVVNKDKNYGHH